MPKTTPSDELRKHFSVLIREHHLELIVFAEAILRDHDTAKDIVQESLLTAWRKFDSFEQDKDFPRWVRGIIRNKCKDWFRKMQRMPIPDLDLVELEIDITNWQSDCAAGQGVFETVEVCVGKLPTNLRAAIDAYYMENRGNRDAAEKLDISQSNLRKRLERGRQLLHDCLSRNMAKNRSDYSPATVPSTTTSPPPPLQSTTATAAITSSKRPTLTRNHA